MNIYQSAIEILKDPAIDYRSIVFEMAKISPSVLVKAFAAVKVHPPSIDGVIHHLRNDRFVPAIKEYRALFGTDLKTSKLAVEKIRDELGSKA